MKRLATLALVLAAALCATSTDAAPLPPFKASLVRVSDGDTFVVKRPDGAEVKIRLHWADTPEIAHNRRERDQPGGREALKFTADLLQRGEVIQVSSRGTSYGRLVADVRVGDTDLALALVERGHAMVDPRYRPSKQLIEAQAEAKKNKAGIWSQPNPVPPSEWRATIRQRNTRPVLRRR